MTDLLSLSIGVQCRVIYALMMREIHTLYGRTQLGYLWAVIKTAIGIAVMWIFRVICGISNPHGMSMLAYLVVGFVLWSIVTSSITKCITAIESNITLLTFPQVTPVDVMVARCLVILCTEIISGVILLLIGYYLGYELYISNIGGLLYILALAYTIGLGVGMILSSLNSYFSTIERIVPIIFRFLMFASGVMFSVTMFTGKIGTWILWNPFLQIIEFTRSCMSSGYPSDFVSHCYLIQIALCSITIGLLLEKHTRKRLMS